MTGDPLAPLPAMLREPAHDALRSAFGVARIDAIAPVAGGASGAFAWRVHSGGRAYLLRMEGTPSPLRNPHQYEAMRIAAEAGIAPRIHHIDETARLAIMDFVPARPLQDFPGGPAALALALGETLQRLLLDTVAQSPELEEALLDGWLGRRANEEARTRLNIVRRLTRLYYAGVFFSASAAANWTTAETDLSTPPLAEFRRAIGEGRLRPGAPQTKHVLGKMFLAAFCSDAPPPGFDAAV